MAGFLILHFNGYGTSAKNFHFMNAGEHLMDCRFRGNQSTGAFSECCDSAQHDGVNHSFCYLVIPRIGQEIYTATAALMAGWCW
jgi:hypothetical protein